MNPHSNLNFKLEELNAAREEAQKIQAERDKLAKKFERSVAKANKANEALLEYQMKDVQAHYPGTRPTHGTSRTRDPPSLRSKRRSVTTRLTSSGIRFTPRPRSPRSPRPRAVPGPTRLRMKACFR